MNYFIKLIIFILAIFLFKKMCFSEDKPYSEQELKSGSYFAKKETREIEKDDFANPGMIWVERGEEIFNLIEGPKNISCASCHNSSNLSLANAATKYPKIDKKEKYLVNLEQKINLCRKNKMDVKSFELESKPLLSLSTYVSYL